MINISLYQPFFGKHKNLYWLEPRITENKCFCFQLAFYPRCIFNFEFRLNRNQDHGGFEFNFGILGLTAEFQFYDRRHWNYDEKRYITDHEAIEQAEDWEKDIKEFKEWKNSRKEELQK